MVKFFTPPQEIDWRVLAYSSDEVQELQGFSRLDLADSAAKYADDGYLAG